jgi:hypothetical protein
MHRRLFGGVWCECSPFASPLNREAAYWLLPEARRRITHARLLYDEDVRDAITTAEKDGRDPTVVQIERGLLTSVELATILMVAASVESHDRPDPELVERGKAARQRSRPVGTSARSSKKCQCRPRMADSRLHDRDPNIEDCYPELHEHGQLSPIYPQLIHIASPQVDGGVTRKFPACKRSDKFTVFSTIPSTKRYLSLLHRRSERVANEVHDYLEL